MVACSVWHGGFWAGSLSPLLFFSAVCELVAGSCSVWRPHFISCVNRPSGFRERSSAIGEAGSQTALWKGLGPSSHFGDFVLWTSLDLLCFLTFFSFWSQISLQLAEKADLFSRSNQKKQVRTINSLAVFFELWYLPVLVSGECIWYMSCCGKGLRFWDPWWSNCLRDGEPQSSCRGEEDWNTFQVLGIQETSCAWERLVLGQQAFVQWC